MSKSYGAARAESLLNARVSRHIQRHDGGCAVVVRATGACHGGASPGFADCARGADPLRTGGSNSYRLQDGLCQAGTASPIPRLCARALCASSWTGRAQGAVPRGGLRATPAARRRSGRTRRQCSLRTGNQRGHKFGTRHAQAGAIKIRHNIPEPSGWAPSPCADPGAGRHRWPSRAPRADPSIAGASPL